MPTKFARDIAIGDKVEHSGQFYEVMDVRIECSVVCCITEQGGRVSFFSNSIVKFY